jgi:phytoene/squalene synthetase
MMRHDPETYRRYAKECQQLAKTMPDEHRPTLLAMAEFWIELAHRAEGSNASIE